jgi:predicted DNA-binding antitoxin AbrB/MazE fold protein
MTIHCIAVYENGILRPKQPLALPEGAEVEIAVGLIPLTRDSQSLAERLAAIAALPVEGNDQGFSGSEQVR